MKKKRCAKCKKLLSVDCFYAARKKGGYLRSDCKRCHNTRESKADYNRKHRYGITVNEYHTMLASQNKRCWICKMEAELFVDHCHTTENVRGLLCRMCNNGIGLLRDNVEIVAEAVKYLLKYR